MPEGCADFLRSALISIHAPLAGRDVSSHADAALISYFNPRAPCGARPVYCCATLRRLPFQSTRPLRGATKATVVGKHRQRYFNPRAPCGARRNHLLLFPLRTCNFNPRAPCGARPLMRSITHVFLPNFNPRAPCGARLMRSITHVFLPNFNPRAPCGARQHTSISPFTRSLFQSTRPLRGATSADMCRLLPTPAFQSTRPLRGATRTTASTIAVRSNFNPRAPCGARPQVSKLHKVHADISIHAPLAGRDIGYYGVRPLCYLFQSTRPLRGATPKT